MLNTNLWPWVALALVLLGLWTGHKVLVNVAVREAVVATEKKMEAEYNKKYLAATAKAKVVEDDLRINANNLRNEKDAQIRNLESERNKLLISLRQRPSRPSSPTALVNSTSCTARELYREDAEFLAGEATRAQSVLIERDYYYQQYESARKIIDAYAGTTGTNDR